MSSRREAPVREKLSQKNLLYRGVPYELLNIQYSDLKLDAKTDGIFKAVLKDIHDAYERKVHLCLYGANGSGKTSLASLIVKEAYRNRYTSYLVNFADLLDMEFQSRTPETTEILKAIYSAEFLVIDEVGKENQNKSGSNIALLEKVLRGALGKGRVVILCTNLPLEHPEDGLYARYGASIKSLIKGTFVKVKFTGDDMRSHVKSCKSFIEGG